MTKFEYIYKHSKILLTEGAIVERIKSEFNLETDMFINHMSSIKNRFQVL